MSFLQAANKKREMADASNSLLPGFRIGASDLQKLTFTSQLNCDQALLEAKFWSRIKNRP